MVPYSSSARGAFRSLGREAVSNDDKAQDLAVGLEVAPPILGRIVVPVVDTVCPLGAARTDLTHQGDSLIDAKEILL